MLALHPQIRAVLSEANCIQRPGEIALARSDQAAAREAYEQAVSLYTKIEMPIQSTKPTGDC